MKIPQTLIDKLSLYHTNEQVGQSFYLNLFIFESNHHLLESWKIMECDLRGNESDYITFYNKNTKRYWETTLEFLIDTNIELVLATMFNQEPI